MKQSNRGMGMEYVQGEVAFSHLTKHESFNGESTGKYSVVITVDADEAKKLEEQGIKLKDYDGKKQRAFKTKFEFQYVDAEKTTQKDELGRGSKVMVAYKVGEPYGNYGTTTYLQGVKVMERVQAGGSADAFEVDESEIDNSDIPF